MDAFNPIWIDRYSQTELLAYMACGYTLDDFKMCGATDDADGKVCSSRGTGCDYYTNRHPDGAMSKRPKQK